MFFVALVVFTGVADVVDVLHFGAGAVNVGGFNISNLVAFGRDVAEVDWVVTVGGRAAVTI